MTRRSALVPNFRTRAITLAICSALGIASVANAQPVDEAEPDSSGGESSTIIYPASFFDDYSPISANDMIDRIPGVSLSSSSSGRGLGSGGDLLINGQRLAGKDNSPRDQLDRIAAREVERIEIIRGTSGDLAVRGSGQVVNIVLQNTGTRASTSVEVSSGFHTHDGTLQPGGSFSHSRQTGDFSVLFNLQADPQYRNEQRNEYSYHPDLTLFEHMHEDKIRDKIAYQTSTTLGYRIGQHRMQLNLLYGVADHPIDIWRDFNESQHTGITRAERERVDYDQNNWEVGGDYEYVLGNGGRAMVLFIVNDETDNNTLERFEVPDALIRADEHKMLYVESNTRNRERILQTSYSWGLAQNQDMQLGVERAQTLLDSSLLVGRDSGSAPTSPAFGGLHPALGISNLGSTVEEMRYEGFAIHNWTLNNQMTLESSLVYETSEISQSGSANRSREFTFWRPSLDYRYNLTNALQVRATVAKEIQQLSFANFSATANTDDTDREADAGNPDLVPTQEMRYELTFEYRLPGDSGVVSSRFFLRDLTDQIGRIDATVNPSSPISASGNIGSAKRWGVYLDGSTRLSFVGMADAMVTSSLNLFDSEVTNPILGTTERINGRGNYSLGFRHDFTPWNMNYGFDYNHPFTGGLRQVEIANIDWNHDGPSLDLFVSRVMFNNITMRLEANNVLNEEDCRNRLRYNGTSASGNIRKVEDSCWGNGRTMALKVRTTF